MSICRRLARPNLAPDHGRARGSRGPRRDGRRRHPFHHVAPSPWEATGAGRTPRRLRALGRRSLWSIGNGFFKRGVLDPAISAGSNPHGILNFTYAQLGS